MCRILLLQNKMSKTSAYILTLMVLLLLPSCKGPKLTQANEQFARGEYFDASKTYRKVYNSLTKKEDRELRGEVAFKMGECYTRLSQFARASAAYQNAIRYHYPDSTAYFLLGRALQAEGKYRDAVEAYDTYLEWQPQDKLAKEGVLGCRDAMEAADGNNTRYVVKNAKLFNSRRADYAPMFLDKNADVLYFTSSTEKATGTAKSEITGAKKADIFYAKKNERGEWQRPEPAEGELNSEMEEGICSFSPDASTMYLTMARRSPVANTTVEIYTSKRSEQSWSKPVKYEITPDTLSAVGHPAVTPDGKWLIFSSDMPGGYGGKDLWRINIADTKGSLENLGPDINTGGDEEFPYMRTDSLLYFASDGHPGFGGLDLFKAQKQPDGGWAVSNMGKPINSSADDFGITFGKGEEGFFSSNRGDARGFDHIYSFMLPDLKITISGYVLDKDDEPIPDAVIRIVGDDGSIQKEVSRDDGSFRFNLARGVKYVMMAGAKGYLNVKEEFESDSAEEDADYAIDFVLASIDKPNMVENIFYDFDKADLRPESVEALNGIAQILEDNPTVTLEMASHTDRHGSEEYNMDLSERRAKSVVDYLISIGIPESRLSWHGYGKTVPKAVTKRINSQYPQFPEGTVLDEQYIETLSEEDKEAADQVNRRTEFSVTSTDYRGSEQEPAEQEPAREEGADKEPAEQ